MKQKNPKYVFLISFLIAFAVIFFIGKKRDIKDDTPSLSPITDEEKKEFHLQKSSFEDLKEWQKDDIENLKKSFLDTCKKLEKEKNEHLGSSLTKIPTKEYLKLCKEASSLKTSFKKWIEKNFNPYLVTFNDSEKGKFTSYYEAAINASHTKKGAYKYPIYGKPNDLIEFNIKDFDKEASSKRFVGRINKNKLVPYYTRKEIEQGKIDAPVILWSDCPVDIYVMQIQGSAVAHLDDGTTTRVGYAENNGHTFKGIGSILLEKGLLQPGQASMGKIKKWLKENNELAHNNMIENDRFIFHTLLNTEGPIGALGVPLHAGRSLAVDTRYIPLGSLLWLETTGPNNEAIEKLVIAQDIGGAIKGAVRGDYFWGSGKDDILDLAGRMNSEGRYFIMLPKE